MQEKEKTCQQLKKKVIRKCSWVFYCVIAVTVSAVAVSWVGEIYYVAFASMLQSFLCDFSQLLKLLSHVNILLENSRENLCEYIYTLSTVTAAVVVLYYTLQDNHREGIPHRKVVAYFAGSWTIGLLFFFENITLILLSVFSSSRGLFGLIAGTLILQAGILIIIILSSSSGFCRWSIKRTEYRQFCYLMKYMITDRQYVWNYLVHHMPQVIAGDDMMFDKAVLVSKLLDVPITYSKKIRQKQDENPSERRKWRVLIYEFYFRNLLMSFEQLTESSEDCNQMFETVYEFLETLDPDNDLLDKEDYLLVISAVLNAAQVSRLVRGEAFCCHVLNKCISDVGLRSKQIFLYLLFLDHLHRTEAEKVQMKELDTIDGLKGLNFVPEDIYAEFWYIWAEQSDIPLKNSIKYLDYALKGLKGKKGASMVMDYYMYIIGR